MLQLSHCSHLLSRYSNNLDVSIISQVPPLIHVEKLRFHFHLGFTINSSDINVNYI